MNQPLSASKMCINKRLILSLLKSTFEIVDSIVIC